MPGYYELNKTEYMTVLTTKDIMFLGINKGILDTEISELSEIFNAKSI